MARPLGRAAALVVAASILAASPAWAVGGPQDLRPPHSPAERPLLATALRLAAAEPLRDVQAPPPAPAAAACACDCRASVAERLAWLYSLIGGSMLTIFGPTEIEDGKWTMDGKSETAAGVAALALSFALLKDIRHRNAAAKAAGRGR